MVLAVFRDLLPAVAVEYGIKRDAILGLRYSCCLVVLINICRTYVGVLVVLSPSLHVTNDIVMTSRFST